MPQERPRIQIQHDLDFQAREYKIQRIAWIVAVFVLAAALGGVFGSGPLSKGTVRDAHFYITIEYDRFARLNARHRLHISGAQLAMEDSQLRLWLGSEFLSSVRIEHITPEPQEVLLAGDRIVYVFPVIPASPSMPQNTRVTFHYQPTSFGRLEGRVGLERHMEVLSFTQFVYP